VGTPNRYRSHYSRGIRLQRAHYWHGYSLLDDTAVERAYLFSSNGDFLFGLVDGHFKYIYNPDLSKPEVYDITSDQAEARSLASVPFESPLIQRDKSRIQAWISFQNKYLRQLAH